MDDFNGAEILRQLRALQDLVGHLPDRSQVRKWHQELTESVEQSRRELDDRVNRVRNDLDKGIRDTRAEQAHTRATLQRRLQWIEYAMRVAAGAQEVDFVPDERSRQYARLAEEARSIRAQLIEPALQRQYRSAVQRWQEWQDEHSHQVTVALGASREIAETEPGSPERSSTVDVYRNARSRLRGLAAQREATKKVADDAQARLDRDAALQEQHEETIKKGDEAWNRLMFYMRTAIAATFGSKVRTSAVRPEWFDTVLGPKPKDNEEAVEWQEVGAELLAYRATYDVTHSVFPLGEIPEGSLVGVRQDWHRQLAAKLRRYH